jgi:hypothetical protein
MLVRCLLRVATSSQEGTGDVAGSHLRVGNDSTPVLDRRGGACMSVVEILNPAIGTAANCHALSTRGDDAPCRPAPAVLY